MCFKSIRSLSRAAVVVVIALLPYRQCMAQFAPHVESVQVKYQDVFQFLELLKSGRTASRKFAVNDVPNWEFKSICDYIAPNGLIVEDVNTKGAVKYSSEDVERALMSKNGSVFHSFSHISFFYSKGKKQYSTVNIIEKHGVVIATLATWYELEFVLDGKRLRLQKCKYINADGD